VESCRAATGEMRKKLSRNAGKRNGKNHGPFIFPERGFRESPLHSPSLLKWDRHIGFISQDVKDILTSTLFNVIILGEIGKEDLLQGGRYKRQRR